MYFKSYHERRLDYLIGFLKEEREKSPFPILCKRDSGDVVVVVVVVIMMMKM